MRRDAADFLRSLAYGEHMTRPAEKIIRKLVRKNLVTVHLQLYRPLYRSALLADPKRLIVTVDTPAAASVGTCSVSRCACSNVCRYTRSSVCRYTRSSVCRYTCSAVGAPAVTSVGIPAATSVDTRSSSACSGSMRRSSGCQRSTSHSTTGSVPQPQHLARTTDCVARHAVCA